MTRLLATDLLTQPLDHEVVAREDVIEGSPTTGVHELPAVGGVEVGVWEISPGTVTDTEVDEVFIVLSGRGTVAFEDGEMIALAPGTVVRLAAGERTTWTISETLRKIYLAAANG